MLLFVIFFRQIKVVTFLLLLLFLCDANYIFSQSTTIQNKHLVIEINNQLQTRINSSFSGAGRLTNDFSSAEYLVSKYFTAKDFIVTKKKKLLIKDAAGSGVLWKFYGINNTCKIEKIVSIKLYDQFRDAAYFTVQYVNKSNREIRVKKWVNHAYKIIPSADTVKFWSFQGSTHTDRRDWIQKVNPGFYDKNFMGMNSSDYGGGIPIIDLWRKDAGLAMGHTEAVAKSISLPLDYDRYASTASIHVEYEYPTDTILNTYDTLSTYETFISVHQKDCFASLRMFSNYMQTKGIKAAAAAPAAFEPIWCAWGYERNFTVKQILQTLPKVKELGIKWVGLDDGYQQAEGDWHTNKDRFPNGDADMKAFVDSIHAQGMKAVIWWAPLAADPGSKVLKANPNILLRDKNGVPQFITWWDAFLMAPTDSAAIAETKNTVKLFLADWGFDALKLDGGYMNACASDYATGHHLQYPEQSNEQLPQLFKTIYETALRIKPNAVVEFCPCGTCASFYQLPYTNQFVSSDPLSSWQVRLKGKVYKALMPATAYFGDHVELTDSKEDFASHIGIGAVPGTKFTFPATGDSIIDENLLTPAKEILFKKWFALYNEKMLSKAVYRGDLYDIGYDKIETHCIQKGTDFYYAYYKPAFSGTIELRGLDANKKYAVTDYFNNKILGTIKGGDPKLNVSFNDFLLIEVKLVD